MTGRAREAPNENGVGVLLELLVPAPNENEEVIPADVEGAEEEPNENPVALLLSFIVGAPKSDLGCSVAPEVGGANENGLLTLLLPPSPNEDVGSV